MRLSEALEDDYQEIKKMDESYDQLDRLMRAMDKGDLGILIDKENRNLDLNDIYKIRRELKTILNDNVFLESGGSRHENGHDTLKLMGRRIGHGVELFGDEALAGLFVSLGVASLSNPITGLIGTAAAGAAAGLAGASVKHQNHILKDLKVAATLIKVCDLLEQQRVTHIPHRGLLRKIMDKLERKSPEQIRNETKKRIKKASMKAEHKFDKLIRNLPKQIEYTDDGQKRTITIEEVFGGL